MLKTLIHLPRVAGNLLTLSAEVKADKEEIGSDRPNPAKIGGQAVLEGVMMRSENSFAVACRKNNGKIVVRESRWHSIWTKYGFLRWPFFRGSVVLAESLVNGFSALSFSAAQMEEAAEESESADEGSGVRGDGPNETEQIETKSPETQPLKTHPKEKASSETVNQNVETIKSNRYIEGSDNKKPDEDSQQISGTMIGFTFAASIALALGLFVGVPHLLTLLLGLSSDTFAFHLVDGGIKAVMVIGYMAAISLIPDIRRVFMYHGAEHQSIAAYEADEELIVKNARKHSRFHPRCGTSFLFIVILISILLFAAVLRVAWVDNGVLDHALKIIVKIPLMLPVAGISYEALKLSGKLKGSPLAMVPVAPGLWLQRLTTREPDDDQLAVALAALRKTLWREKAIRKNSQNVEKEDPKHRAHPRIEVFDSYKEIVYE